MTVVATQSTGGFSLDVMDGQALYTLTVAMAREVTQAHIHLGGADEMGE